MCDSLGKQGKYDLVVKWINYYVAEYSRDMDRMKYLFYIISNAPKVVFKQALILFCKTNSRYEDFALLPLDATAKRWSGSEIPLIDIYLDFLEELKRELRGFEFIAHRAHISSKIQSARSYRSRVEAGDFLERL